MNLRSITTEDNIKAGDTLYHKTPNFSNITKVTVTRVTKTLIIIDNNRYAKEGYSKGDEYRRNCLFVEVTQADETKDAEIKALVQEASEEYKRLFPTQEAPAAEPVAVEPAMSGVEQARARVAAYEAKREAARVAKQEERDNALAAHAEAMKKHGVTWTYAKPEPVASVAVEVQEVAPLTTSSESEPVLLVKPSQRWSEWVSVTSETQAAYHGVDMLGNPAVFAKADWHVAPIQQVEQLQHAERQEQARDDAAQASHAKESMPLEDALRSYPTATLFNDGADIWDADNLISGYSETSEGLIDLNKLVYPSEVGIYAYKEDGYLESSPFLMVAIPYLLTAEYQEQQETATDHSGVAPRFMPLSTGHAEAIAERVDEIESLNSTISHIEYEICDIPEDQRETPTYALENRKASLQREVNDRVNDLKDEDIKIDYDGPLTQVKYCGTLWLQCCNNTWLEVVQDEQEVLATAQERGITLYTVEETDKIRVRYLPASVVHPLWWQVDCTSREHAIERVRETIAHAVYVSPIAFVAAYEARIPALLIQDEAHQVQG